MRPGDRASGRRPGGRFSRRGGGGAPLSPPVITAAPVLTWTIGVGTSPAITPPTYTGSPGTIAYTLKRDGVAVAGATDVSEAALEAYVTDTSADGANDVGPSMTVTATVTNGAGSDSDDSNAVTYLHATRLAQAAIGVSTSGVTQATGTASAWATSLGGLTLTLSAPLATNEPAYSETGGVGGRPLITFDGSDNVLRLLAWTSGVTWDDYEIGIVGHRVATSADNDIFIGYYTGGFARFALRDLDAATFKFVVAGGATSVSTTDPDTTPRHLSGSSSGGSQSLRVNGTAEDTDAGATTSRADGGSAVLGAATDATAASNIAIQAFYFSRALTADQRTELRALLSYHTGVAC